MNGMRPIIKTKIRLKLKLEAKLLSDVVVSGAVDVKGVVGSLLESVVLLS